MKVLVACEYSGIVRRAFAAQGHVVISTDFEPAEDNSLDHFQGDCLDLITTQPFDLMIAHPPCTYLSSSGMHWTTRGLRDKQLTEDALLFVQKLMGAPIEKIAIENPVGVISSRIRPPDQIIQPYEFGEDASKRTCLWLKGLPTLQATKLIAPRMFCCGLELITKDRHGCQLCGRKKAAQSRWGNQLPSGQNKLAPNGDRWKERSRTYPGIATAMVEQWGNY